jgi:DNA (cytosine-5)-methyltransferase 1
MAARALVAAEDEVRYGSVCSGIEAASVAWHGLGWVPAFFSEIEPFPKAVLAHRWPGIPDLGDFTKIGEEHGPVDLLVGGTPCQSFSVAGLRGGMADARGNLALEFLRLAARLHARWVLWENVPGVLSSNGGRDFGALLGGLAELGYGTAYRVLDAQHVGTCELHGGRGRSAVPQRRRRVFVVGHAGGLWQRAAAVLFERASLRGDPPPSRAKGAGSTGGARGCTPIGFYPTGGTHGVSAVENGSPSLKIGSGGTSGNAPAIIFDTTQITSALNRSAPAPGDPSHPLAAGAHPPAIAFHVTQDPISGDVTPALGCGNALGCGTLGVAVAIQDTGSKESGQNGAGVSAGGPAYTVDTTGRQGVATYSLSPGACGTPEGQEDIYINPSDVARTIDCTGGDPSRKQGGTIVNAAMAVRRLTPRECERLQGFPDDYTAIPYGSAVRPEKITEDWIKYLMRGGRISREEVARIASDGPRYRALGNSMAVPVMRWIGQRIALVDAAVQTQSEAA